MSALARQYTRLVNDQVTRFNLAADNWIHLTPFGEFRNDRVNVIQVVDQRSADAQVAAFNDQARQPNFAGLLVDFDHFSITDNATTQAAGWITNMRVSKTGLWAKVRWTDIGEEYLAGGRYRFVSPVWRIDNKGGWSEAAGPGRIRPMRLDNLALTNNPNIKGAIPLTNSRVPWRTLLAECRTPGTPTAKPTQPTTMSLDLKDLKPITTALGMPEGSTVEQIVSECTIIRTENDAHATTLANSELEKFPIAEGTQDYWKQQLLVNRDATLKTLNLMFPGGKPAASTTPATVLPVRANRTPLHAPNAAVNPVDVSADTAAAQKAASESRAAQVRNRAHQIQAQEPGTQFITAWNRADKETPKVA